MGIEPLSACLFTVLTSLVGTPLRNLSGFLQVLVTHAHRGRR